MRPTETPLDYMFLVTVHATAAKHPSTPDNPKLRKWTLDLWRRIGRCTVVAPSLKAARLGLATVNNRIAQGTSPYTDDHNA